MSAIAAVMLAGLVASATPAFAGQDAGTRPRAAASAAEPDACELKADIPGAIRKGEAVTLILHVSKAGRPVDRAVACLAAVPLFIDVEDALDSTPAGGADLGSEPALAAHPCTMAMAGIPGGPGRYVFTWEPDTAGRVNLTFTAGGGRLTTPVNVASAPPSSAILAAFAALVAIAPVTALWLRRRRLQSANSAS